MELSSCVRGRKVFSVNACLMMNKKPPTLYSSILTAGTYNYGFGNETGYIRGLAGSLNPNVFEGINIEVLNHRILLNCHSIIFQSGLISPIDRISINGIEYNLIFINSSQYNFSPGSSLFTNSETYNIEFIRT